MSVRTLLRASKDAALALAVRSFVNARYREIGEMTEIVIDTKKRAVRIRLELAGEAQALEIHVKRYSLKRTGAAASLVVLDAVASRQWLTAALRAFVIGRAFRVPAGAASALKVLT